MILRVLLLAIPLFAAEEEDQERAFQGYLRVAEQTHDPEAQFQTAIRYAKGVGTDMNKPRAVYWLRQAAEQGHGPSQINLGIAYMTGSGVKPSKGDAYAWIYKAAQKGFTLAQGLVKKLEAKMQPEEIAAAQRKSADLGRLNVFKGFSGYQLSFPRDYEALPRSGKGGFLETVYFYPRGTPPARLKESDFSEVQVIRLDVLPRGLGTEASKKDAAGIVQTVIEGKSQIYLFSAGKKDGTLESMLQSFRE